MIYLTLNVDISHFFNSLIDWTIYYYVKQSLHFFKHIHEQCLFDVAMYRQSKGKALLHLLIYLGMNQKEQLTVFKGVQFTINPLHFLIEKP